jgi:histidyl-tRNA synthetase
MERRVAALTAMDKFDKLGADGVHAELQRAGLDDSSREQLMAAMAVSGSPQAVSDELRALLNGNARGQAALTDLSACFGYLSDMGVPPERYALDLSVVRGLSYYTGIIYETVAAGVPVGSLASGGRYDNLVGMFLGHDVPCVGISFGIDRMFDAMALLGLSRNEAATATQALVTLFSTVTIPEAFSAAGELRQAGIRTEIYAEPKELRPQLAFASKKGIPLAVMIGPDEIARAEVTVRDLRSGTQRTMARRDLLTTVREALVGA